MGRSIAIITVAAILTVVGISLLFVLTVSTHEQIRLTPLSPRPALSKEDINVIGSLVKPSESVTQRDVFGTDVSEPNDNCFEVSADQSTAIVQLDCASQYLFRCHDTIANAYGAIPHGWAVTVQFGAYEIANLSPQLFASVPSAQKIELRLVAFGADKYGHPDQQQLFFQAIISREQETRMDWQWFRSAIPSATFDPEAFERFSIMFGDPLSRQDTRGVLAVMRGSAEEALAAYGLPYNQSSVLRSSMQLSNLTCIK